NSAGELAHRFHFLRLPELLFGGTERFFGSPPFRSLGADAKHLTRAVGKRQRDPACLEPAGLSGPGIGHPFARCYERPATAHHIAIRLQDGFDFAAVAVEVAVAPSNELLHV